MEENKSFLSDSDYVEGEEDWEDLEEDWSDEEWED